MRDAAGRSKLVVRVIVDDTLQCFIPNGLRKLSVDSSILNISAVSMTIARSYPRAVAKVTAWDTSSSFFRIGLQRPS